MLYQHVVGTISSAFCHDGILRIIVNFARLCRFTWHLFLTSAQWNKQFKFDWVMLENQSLLPATDGFHNLTPLIFRNLKILFPHSVNSEVVAPPPSNPPSVFDFNTLEFLVRMAPSSLIFCQNATLTIFERKCVFIHVFLGRVLMWKVSSCHTKFTSTVCDMWHFAGLF